MIQILVFSYFLANLTFGRRFHAGNTINMAVKGTVVDSSNFILNGVQFSVKYPNFINFKLSRQNSCNW